MPSLLIVDDEANIRGSLQVIKLGAADHAVLGVLCRGHDQIIPLHNAGDNAGITELSAAGTHAPTGPRRRQP